MMENTAWEAFTRLRYEHPEDALRQIAGLVRVGCSDPMFLKLLADHIDPDVVTTPLGTKLRLVRTTGRKAPPKVPNYELREFLERFLDIFPDGEPAEAVKAEAMSRFDVSRSTCGVEIGVMRRWQQRNPDAFQDRKTWAEQMRDAGHQDFQPLWPRK